MHRSIGRTAVVVFCATAARVCAEPTPGPPDWHDGGGSVYQAMSQTAPAVFQPAAEAQPITTPRVEHAVHHVPAQRAAESSTRHLPPPNQPASTRHGNENAILPVPERHAAGRSPFNFGLPLASIYTMCTALALVVGAFLLFVWLLRRGMKAGNAMLPADVVSVLGRVPLSARQMAELLRVGNKLVLISVTPSGAETLTEVTDPVEVDRLVGLCQQYNPHSTTKAFESVFQQLSSEPAPDSLFGSDSLPPTLSSATAAYRIQRGDLGRA